MDRYYVEMEHPRGKEEYGTFYIYMMAYNSTQVVDMFGDEYYVVAVDQTE